MSRYAKNTIPYKVLPTWFDRALKSTDPRPSDATLDCLSREFKELFHRANNAELQRDARAGNRNVPLSKLKDVSPAEWADARIEAVERGAANLLAATIELERYAPEYGWEYADGDVSLPELQETLRRVKRHGTRAPRRKPTRGRPPVPWREAGRQFAQAVIREMRAVGYKGRLGIRDAESVTAVVAARAISWAYHKRLSPSGFVSAMRNRARAKALKNKRPKYSE
jgi:hypothetical protein